MPCKGDRVRIPAQWGRIMTRSSPRPYAYARMLAGPPLDAPWTVTDGLVAVIGRKLSIVLPPGATWPGVSTLPADWLDDLQPTGTVATAGSQWVDAGPADLPAGVALVHAQLLRSGALIDRLGQLDKLGIGAINQFIQAAAIDSTRESVSKLRRKMRRDS